MGFLQRSKSAAVVEQTSNKGNAILRLEDLPTGKGAMQRAAVQERPKTADNATSFSRPRTAGAPIGRPADFPLPSFKIDFKAGDEVFSFPTPSPRLPPTKNAAVHVPSSLGQLEPTNIGLAIGSPDQTRTSWDEAAVQHVATTTAPPPPTRPPPVIPEHPDLEMPLTSIKKKKPGWKTFGSLFSRKPAKVVTAVADDSKALVQDDVLDELAAMLADIEPPKPPVRQPTSSLARSNPQNPFEQADSSKALRSPLIIKTEGLSPMFRSIQGLPEARIWVDDPRKDSPLSLMSPMSFKSKDDAEIIAKPSTPTLVLDLPDPKFERYSIMFERVLNGSQPSLLERRQSRLNRSLSIKRLDLDPEAQEPPEVPRLQLNGVPQRSATSPSLTRIGKKMLSPISEVFSSLRSPRTVRRSKTLPPSAASTLKKKLSNLDVDAGLSPSVSGTQDDCSMPPTPMTFNTISDCDSVDDPTSDDLPLEFEKAEAAWNAAASEAGTESLDPYLRMKQMEKHVLQASVAKQINVGKAMAELRQSVAWRHPVRQRLVELNKNRSSTVVIVESVAG